MTPLELVQGVRVESIRVGAQTMKEVDPSRPGVRRRGSTVCHYNVTVVFPNGLKKNVSTAWDRLGRRVARAAGLRLSGKAAMAAALEANTKIFAAVEAFRQSEECARLEKKAMDAEARKVRRKEERAAMDERRRDVNQILHCLRRTFLTQEELLEIWRAAQVSEVMES
jgi:hypothetical protein